MVVFDDFPVFISSAVLALTITAIVNADCDIKSATGLFLTGHEYLSFPEEDFQQCYEKCKADEPKCRSLNYHTDQQRCDLNNATKTLHPEDVMENPFSLYFESRHRGKLYIMITVRYCTLILYIIHLDALCTKILTDSLSKVALGFKNDLKLCIQRKQCQIY